MLRHRLKSSVFNDDILSTLYKEKEKVKPKVCFLSGKERDTTAAGHSRFECEYSRETLGVGPGSYNPRDPGEEKVTSRAGCGGLASKTPRFVYPPREVRLSLKVRRDSKVPRLPFHRREAKIAKPPPPFGSAQPRKTGIFGKKDESPGCCYDTHRAYRKREMEFEHSFGGRTRLKPHVLWKCTPENTDICCNCQKKPHGDYHISGDKPGGVANVLCIKCFESEWSRPRKFTHKQLKAFKTIRDCSDIHEHGGTTAAVMLVSNRDIRKQRYLESYFASFASPRKVVKRINIAEPKCQFAKSMDKQLTVLFEKKPKD